MRHSRSSAGRSFRIAPVNTRARSTIGILLAVVIGLSSA
jgi:hypothetical protein